MGTYMHVGNWTGISVDINSIVNAKNSTAQNIGSTQSTGQVNDIFHQTIGGSSWQPSTYSQAPHITSEGNFSAQPYSDSSIDLNAINSQPLSESILSQDSTLLHNTPPFNPSSADSVVDHQIAPAINHQKPNFLDNSMPCQIFNSTTGVWWDNMSSQQPVFDPTQVRALHASMDESIHTLRSTSSMDNSLIQKAFIEYKDDKKGYEPGYKSKTEMLGVGIAASLLKTQDPSLKNLYVCDSLKIFEDKMNEIKTQGDDGKYAFILSWYAKSDDLSTLTLDPYHKIAVGVEKENGRLNCVMLDSVGGDLTQEIEYPENSILHHLENTSGSLYYCSTAVERQKSLTGCEAFALNDAVSFLKNPDFFKQLRSIPYNTSSPNSNVSINNVPIHEITALPPDLMRGTQSLTALKKYSEQYFTSTPDQAGMISKAELEAIAKAHTVMNPDIQREQNQYNSLYSYIYRGLIFATVKTLTPSELEGLIRDTFLRIFKPK